MSEFQQDWNNGVDQMIQGHKEMAEHGFDFDKRIDTSVQAMYAKEVQFQRTELAHMLATAVDRLANS
jgi:hypothetical protein